MSRSTRSEVYRRVLGIPPEEQPPHHYRLLGLEPYEDDAALIKERLEQRSRLITVHRKGEYTKACEEILYQINTAKTCLLNPRLKTAYDRKLLANRSMATAATARTSGSSMAATKSTTSTAPSRTTQAAHASNRPHDPADDDLSLAPLPEDAPMPEDRIAEDDDPSTDVLGDLEQFLSDHFAQHDDASCDPTEEIDLVLDSNIFSLDAGATTKKETREVDTVIDGTLGLSDLSELDDSLTAETPVAEPTPASEPTGAQVTTPAAPSKDTQPLDADTPQPLSTDNMPAVDLLIPDNAGYEVIDPEELANEGFDLLDAHDFALDDDTEQANAASEAADPAELAVRELAGQEQPQPDCPPAEHLTQPTSTESTGEVFPNDQLAASSDEPVDSLTSVDAVDSPAAIDDPENLEDIESVDDLEATETDNQPQDDPSEASSSSWLRRPVLLAGVVLIGCLPLVGLFLWNAGSSANSSSFDQPIPRPPIARHRPMEPAPKTPAPETRPIPTANQPAVTPQPAVSTSHAPDLPPLAPVPAELATKLTTEPADKPAEPLDRQVEIGVACSTEKAPWLTWAATQFATTEPGRQIHVEIIPLDSQASARAIIGGDTHIHVWSPASTVYRDTFLREWQAKHYAERNVPDNPLIKSEILAITPMVLVMWKSRYEAFTAKVPEITFTNLGHAMHLKTGWETIADKPKWGRFKFGHTHPARSNSGLMTLILLTYDFHEKTADLGVNDVMSREFLDHLEWFGDGVAEVAESTDGLMKQMILMGPSVVDALMVYEAVAIDYLPKAEGRWGQLQVIYPKYNAWNDNPYYVLNTPWTTQSHRRAAERFLAFLLDDPSQRKALELGFRPGNPAIPVNGPDSPFTRFAKNGLRLEVPTVCKPPSPVVIENLQQTWLRNAARR